MFYNDSEVLPWFPSLVNKLFFKKCINIFFFFNNFFLCSLQCVSPVHQTAVSFRSLASDLDSGDFSAVPADPDPSATAVEELSVCSSTAGGFPWFKDSWRNRGSSSCSLVKRPRWSSTLQHWALVSRSSNPNTHRQTNRQTHTIKKMPPLYNIKQLSIISISTWVAWEVDGFPNH